MGIHWTESGFIPKEKQKGICLEQLYNMLLPHIHCLLPTDSKLAVLSLYFSSLLSFIHTHELFKEYFKYLGETHAMSYTNISRHIHVYFAEH